MLIAVFHIRKNCARNLDRNSDGFLNLIAIQFKESQARWRGFKPRTDRRCPAQSFMLMRYL